MKLGNQLVILRSIWSPPKFKIPGFLKSLLRPCKWGVWRNPGKSISPIIRQSGGRLLWNILFLYLTSHSSARKRFTSQVKCQGYLCPRKMDNNVPPSHGCVLQAVAPTSKGNILRTCWRDTKEMSPELWEEGRPGRLKTIVPIQVRLSIWAKLLN